MQNTNGQATPQTPQAPLTSQATPESAATLGAIALEGSGFEDETPLAEYTGTDNTRLDGNGVDPTQTDGANHG